MSLILEEFRVEKLHSFDCLLLTCELCDHAQMPNEPDSTRLSTLIALASEHRKTCPNRRTP